jgi:DNA mismatch endonuclease (patch repair protein)
MADVHEPEVRSYNMSQIKGKNTKPEIIVRKFLHSNGFRYRLHVRDLPGKPDIVLKKYNTVIFIHGCFWHGHKDCKYYVIPKTRTKWWLEKIKRNKEKDNESIKALKQIGWDSITIWECELKKDKRQHTLESLVYNLSRTNSH